MELLDKKIKEYIASVSVPDEIKPSRIKQFIEDNGVITAGKFLKKLRELKISGSDFMELLGNSRIGNIQYRRIEENPHLRFDELLQILDSSDLTSDDYSAMLSVAMAKRKQSEDRKRREQETLRRVSLEEKGVSIPIPVEEPAPADKVAPTIEAESDMDSSPVEEAPAEVAHEIQESEPENTADESPSEVPEEEETEITAPETAETVIFEDEYTESIEEETEERSSFVEAGTNEELSAEKTEEERTAAAEALIAKIQASINSSLLEEQKTISDFEGFVKNDTDYTDSIEETESEAYDEPEAVQDAYEESETVSDSDEEPETESESYEESEAVQDTYEETETRSASEEQVESDDTDAFDDDAEEVGSSAREIGDVLNELLDEKDRDSDEDEEYEEDDEDGEEAEEPATRKSKGFLIAAFVCAAVVICCAVSLKVLRYYEIIPSYIFKIPEIVRQNIVDFPSLLEEVNKAENTIGYNLPDGFITSGKTVFTPSKNAVGETVCLAVTEKDAQNHITGTTLDNGKVGESFSFDVGMSDVSVEYSNGYFIVIGNTNNMTEVRFYSEDTISEGKADFSYKQSGKYAGYYTDSNAFYVVTENRFNLLDARADKLTSFIPSFEINGNLSVVPFDRISMPEYAARTNYCTVSRLPFDMGQTKIRSVLMGDAGGYHISEKGLFTCDNTYLNESYRSRVTVVAFDEDLTAKHTDIDGAINPAMLMSSGERFIAVGMAKTEKENANAVFRFDAGLSEAPAVLSPIANGSSFEKVICGDEVLTLITAGEKPMQYNINIADLSSAEKGTTAKNRKKINNELSASINVSFSDEGKRTGIVLTVGEASVTANVKKDTATEWDAYLDSPFISDISELPFYEDGDGVIVGLPLTFFDGISQVGEYRFYRYKDNKLSEIGRISLYDTKFTTVYCGFTSGDKPCILTLWDNKVITADIENVKIISESEIRG
ncbi:MAG: hypothetical protein IJZ51_05885 [Ruminiclostridium sp.]|nr:hypothetical protein [Ruminiclostridium sp.]